jgi:hypothetical protein
MNIDIAEVIKAPKHKAIKLSTKDNKLAGKDNPIFAGSKSETIIIGQHLKIVDEIL